MAQQMIEGTLTNDWSQFKSEFEYKGKGPFCGFKLSEIVEVCVC
jgi:hypothetical protein